MAVKKIRVVLGDLQTLNLDGMSAVLKSNKMMSVVAAADEPKDLAEAVKKRAPDVVVVDAHMLLRMKSSINGTSRVIQIADDDTAVRTTPNTKGILRRTSGAKELQNAIRRVARGETYDLPKVPSSRTKLSRREQDITRLVSKGLTNRSIAEILGLSEQSVKNLVSRVLKKLNLENRVQIALSQN